MKIAFWGSSDFSMPSLRLIAGNFSLAGVITNPDACCGRGMKDIRRTPVKEFALERNIPVLQPESLKSESFFSAFSDLGADLSVVVSYGMIIPERILYLPRLHSINLHGSLLPKYRGASPIQTALANGDTMTGNTVQYMVKELDKGDIILQQHEAIRPEDNYITLSERLAVKGADLLVETINQIAAGKESRKKQIDSEASFCSLIKKENGRISFIADTANQIYNKWRAFYSWPGIFTNFANKAVCEKTGDDSCLTYLTDIRLLESQSGTPGTIIQSDKHGLVVACREGALSILRLKPAGKKDMDYLGFINGYKPSLGRYF